MISSQCSKLTWRNSLGKFLVYIFLTAPYRNGFVCDGLDNGLPIWISSTERGNPRFVRPRELSTSQPNPGYNH